MLDEHEKVSQLVLISVLLLVLLLQMVLRQLRLQLPEAWSLLLPAVVCCWCLLLLLSVPASDKGSCCWLNNSRY